MEQCYLCGRTEILQYSHIIPKFVFKWLKETGSGYLRSGENFNIRVQDGPKHRMLCSTCEQAFGDDETFFASRIFYPIVDNNTSSFSYNERLCRFVISVMWRLIKKDFIPLEQDPVYLQLLVKLEQDYREYLLGEKNIPEFNRIHLLCGVDVRKPDEINKVALPKRFIHYFARQVDAGVTGNNEHKFVYFKLPRMLFLVPIQGLDEHAFQNTRIDFVSGNYQSDQAGIHAALIGNYFHQRSEQLDEELSNISPSQQDKIKKVTEEKWEEVQKKDLGNILNYQQSAFNDQQKL